MKKIVILVITVLSFISVANAQKVGIKGFYLGEKYYGTDQWFDQTLLGYNGKMGISKNQKNEIISFTFSLGHECMSNRDLTKLISIIKDKFNVKMYLNENESYKAGGVKVYRATFNRRYQIPDSYDHSFDYLSGRSNNDNKYMITVYYKDGQKSEFVNDKDGFEIRFADIIEGQKYQEFREKSKNNDF